MKIATIPQMTYTPGKLEYFQFIRGGVGADYHQGPSFFQFDDGTVRMIWGAYDYDECSPNSVALYSESRDRGLTWSDPQVYMADITVGQKQSHLLKLQNGNEVLMCVVQVTHQIEIDEKTRLAVAGSDYFAARSTVFIRRSVDGGRYFDHGFEIPWQEFTGGRGLRGGGMYYGDIFMTQLQSGRIILAGDYLDPDLGDIEKKIQHCTGVCMISDDLGYTWRRSQNINVDVERGVMEMHIVETAPDQLFCLFRTKGGYLYQTTSADGGETWSKTGPSPLTAPESIARMIKLQSGNILVIWNNVSSTTQQPRHPLCAVVSKDGGKSWGSTKIIADEHGTNQLSNHAVIQLDDGRILLAISHYRDVRPMTSDVDFAIFDEQWLES